jgi:hypothetical protein
VRELLAVEYGIRSLLPHLRHKLIQIQSDNITTVAHINKMGGTNSRTLLQVTKRLWMFCLKRALQLRAIYLPGSSNFVEDNITTH